MISALSSEALTPGEKKTEKEKERVDSCADQLKSSASACKNKHRKWCC